VDLLLGADRLDTKTLCIKRLMFVLSFVKHPHWAGSVGRQALGFRAPKAQFMMPSALRLQRGKPSRADRPHGTTQTMKLTFEFYGSTVSGLTRTERALFCCEPSEPARLTISPCRTSLETPFWRCLILRVGLGEH